MGTAARWWARASRSPSTGRSTPKLNARIQARAIALGGPITYLDPEEARRTAEVNDRVHTRSWELWKRSALGKPQ